jgi:hypothetical protein
MQPSTHHANQNLTKNNLTPSGPSKTGSCMKQNKLNSPDNFFIVFAPSVMIFSIIIQFNRLFIFSSINNLSKYSILPKDGYGLMCGTTKQNIDVTAVT